MNDLLVVKAGTSTLTSEGGQFAQERCDDIARQIEYLRYTNATDVVVVSSAAISAGAAELGVNRDAFIENYDGLSMLSAIGQPLLMATWRQAFAPRVVAQHLVTRTELAPESTERSAYFAKLAYSVKTANVQAVVNENDPVSDEEIRIGDNDQISAMVAVGLGQLGLWQSVKLVILSDVDGLYENYGAANARLLRSVTDVGSAERMAGPAAGVHSSGGMVTKLAAVRLMLNAGYEAHIANGSLPNALSDAYYGKIGTHFTAGHVE